MLHHVERDAISVTDSLEYELTLHAPEVSDCGPMIYNPTSGRLDHMLAESLKLKTCMAQPT